MLNAPPDPDGETHPAEAQSPDETTIACKANFAKTKNREEGGGTFSFGLGKWNFKFTVVKQLTVNTNEDKYFWAKR